MRHYMVEYIGKDQLISSSIDITESVQEVTGLNYSGTETIPTAKITIKTPYGYHITNNDSNTKPIISRWDFIRITIKDDVNTYSKIMYVDNKDKQDTGAGQLLILTLLGREALLKDQKITGNYYEYTIKDMVREIVQQYNASKLSFNSSPLLGIDDFNVPDFPISTFNWTENGTNMYDALISCIDLLGQGASAGGAGDLFELVFEDEPSANGVMFVNIFPQGTRKGIPNIPTLEVRNAIEVIADEPTERSNIEIIRGAQDRGLFPRELSVYESAIEFYEIILSNRPWNSQIEYSKGAYVNYGNKVYQATITSTNARPSSSSSFWTVKFEKDFIGDINYSPWTKDKASLWRNGCLNPTGNLFPLSVPHAPNHFPDLDTLLAVPDGNMVIHETIDREWADVVGTSPNDIPEEWLYPRNGSIDRFYEGFRIFIKDTPTTAPFNGSDIYGNSYEGKIAQYSRNGEWIVINPGTIRDESQVIIYRTNTVYEYSPNTFPNPVNRVIDAPRSWKDASGFEFVKDMLHYPHVFENVEGLVKTISSSNGNYNDRSGIRISYLTRDIIDWNVDATVENILTHFINILSFSTKFPWDQINDFFGKNTTLVFNHILSVGWWASLEFPFPKTTYNGIGENVGQLYGGTTDSKIPNLDVDNTRLMFDGKKGFGHESSKSFGELRGISFLFNFAETTIGHGGGPEVERFIQDGDIPFDIFITDIHSNVLRHRFNVRYGGRTEQIIIPFTAFSEYRARLPLGLSVDSILNQLNPPEISPNRTFEWRNIKRITIQYARSYDEEGRYNGSTEYIKRIGVFIVGGVRSLLYTGTIDSFGFYKAPISISKKDITKRITTDNIKDRPDVYNILQLDDVANYELDLATHIIKTYEYTDKGKCDIKIGQFVNLHGEDLIENIDGVTNNSIKLVVDDIKYTVSNKGGFKRTLFLSRRLE